GQGADAADAAVVQSHLALSGAAPAHGRLALAHGAGASKHAGRAPIERNSKRADVTCEPDREGIMNRRLSLAATAISLALSAACTLTSSVAFGQSSVQVPKFQ